MRYPPALTFTPHASWAYRVFAVLVTMFLIAISVVFVRASGTFSYEKYLYIALVGTAGFWLLRDAARQPSGSLRFTQGQWVWMNNGQETAGTLSLHLDLQRYMLVSFRAHPAPDKLFPTTPQWFHIEAGRISCAMPATSATPAARDAAWSTLRRAIYSPVERADETLAA